MRESGLKHVGEIVKLGSFQDMKLGSNCMDKKIEVFWELGLS